MGKTLIKILFLTLIFDSNLESRPLKKQKLNNYNIKGIQNWVHNSFNNENNSSKREKFSKNFFCSLVLGSFPELKNLNKTIYHPYKFKTKNLKLSPNYLGLINISKYKFLNKEQIFGFYKNLYKDLKFIKKCEIHSFFYKNNSGIETIKYSFHLSGKTSKGYWFEEHSKIKVKFKNKQNWPESVLFERIFRSIKNFNNNFFSSNFRYYILDIFIL